MKDALFQVGRKNIIEWRGKQGDERAERELIRRRDLEDKEAVRRTERLREKKRQDENDDRDDMIVEKQAEIMKREVERKG